jgi:hypothetical protein
MTEITGRSIHAVSPLDGYPPEIGAWLWALEDARRRTRIALENVPAAAIDWHAPDGGHTIGTLLYHIAAIELDWVYVEVLETEIPASAATLFPYEVREPDGRLTPVSGHSLDDHWVRLNTTRGLLLKAYNGMSIEEYRRMRTLPHYDVSPEWVLHHLCQHEAEHRDEIRRLRQQAEAASGAV